MKLTFSGVHFSAARTRSASFSLFLWSRTIRNFPDLKSATAFSIFFMLFIKTWALNVFIYFCAKTKFNKFKYLYFRINVMGKMGIILTKFLVLSLILLSLVAYSYSQTEAVPTCKENCECDDSGNIISCHAVDEIKPVIACSACSGGIDTGQKDSNGCPIYSCPAVDCV